MCSIVFIIEQGKFCSPNHTFLCQLGRACESGDENVLPSAPGQGREAWKERQPGHYYPLTRTQQGHCWLAYWKREQIRRRWSASASLSSSYLALGPAEGTWTDRTTSASGPPDHGHKRGSHVTPVSGSTVAMETGKRQHREHEHGRYLVHVEVVGSVRNDRSIVSHDLHVSEAECLLKFVLP